MKLTARRDILRSSTAAAHEALEARIGPLDSQSAYIAYALGLHAFRTPLEHDLDAFEDGRFGDWRPKNIAWLLAQDLADLGISPIKPEPNVIMHSRAWALGAHYVLEGSCLGARVLKPAAAALGFTEGHGARHLETQAASLDNFRAFMALLEGADGLDMEMTIQGANNAFEAAESAMHRARAYA